MFQGQKRNVLIGLIAILFFAATIFYSVAGAQPANANQVVKMIDEWKAKSLKNGQWVRLVYAVTTKADNGIVLPDGQTMPSSYVNDDWYYINDAGLVEKGVFSMKDSEGNILQQSALQNNILINFTFEDRQENQELYPLQIDLGFENKIREAKNKGQTIKKSNDKVDGQPTVVYLLVEKLKLPTQMGNESVIVDSITTKGNFSTETGDFVQTQTIWTLNDGTEVVYETARITSVESFPNAPDEILNILESVK